MPDDALRVPLACAEHVGIGLVLFRAALLVQTAEEATLSFAEQRIRPLSDEGIEIAVREPAELRRAIEALGSHPESTDPLYAVVQRIICFVELLREQDRTPHPMWAELLTRRDHFHPIVNAIAWCQAYKEHPLDVVLFAGLAERLSQTSTPSVREQ